MKNIYGLKTLLTGLFSCLLITASAQTVTIGSGTTTTTSTGSDPIDGYYESFRYQVVYTAAELTAAGLPANSYLTGLGFSIAGDYGGGNLAGYTIKIGATTATNSAAHDASTTAQVKNPFAYNPTVTAAGVFDMITFDANFLWNGTDNILIDICSGGANPFTSPYGQVRTIATSTTNGSRFVRDDGLGSFCGVNTTTTNSTKPQIRFSYISSTPCSGAPSAGTIPASLGFCSGTSVNLVSTGSTAASGISLQWQESDDNGVSDIWANTSTGTGSTTTSFTSAALTNAIYYRLRAICTATNDTAYSNVSQASPAFCTWDVARTTGTAYTSISTTGISATGWRNALSTDDNLSTSQPIGFPFVYQGNSYSNFSVSTNGFLTFNVGTTATGGGIGTVPYNYNNPDLSSTAAPSPLTLAPFWEDMVCQGNPGTLAGLNSSIKYQVDGIAPNRVLTVEWIGFEIFTIAGPDLNFQVKLHETTGNIEYVYGKMQGFDGTFNTAYSYSIGMNGSTMSASPTVTELFTQQVANEKNFGNTAQNSLIAVPECNTTLSFTPGVYSGNGPAAGVPANDNVGSALMVNVNSSPCIDLCGTYYTSRNATNSGSGQACATTAGNEDDDVWFKFQTNNIATDYTIKLRCSPNYNGVLQLLDSAYNQVNCVNATGAGLTENITALGLVDSGATYYVRVFHNGTGTGTSYGQFSLCVSQVVNPPANDTICSAIALTNATTCIPVSGTTIVATQSPQAVTCGTPDDDVWYKFTAVTANPKITVQSGSGYNAALQIMSSSNNTCSGTLTSVACINATATGGAEAYTGTALTPGNTYFVRVYHSAAGAGAGAFNICYVESTPACVTYTAPAVNAPYEPATGTTLTWNAAASATGYDVYFSTSYDSVMVNSSTALVSANQAALMYATGTLTTNTKYYWKVNSLNVVGASPACAVDSFTTAPPCTTPTVGGSVTGPANGSVGATGVYLLSGQTGTTIQWKSSLNVNGPFTNVAGSSSTNDTASIAWAVSDTIYYIAVSSTPGCASANSDTIVTYVGPACAVHTSPANNAVNRPVSGINLQWNAAAGATGYDVYLSPVYARVSGDSASARVATNQSALLYFTGALTTGTKYYWKVNSRNSVAIGGGCAVDSFTTVPPCTTATVGGMLSGPLTGNVGSTGAYADNGYTGATIQWQSSVNAIGPYTNIAGATSFTPTIIWTIADTIYYRASVSTPGCPSAFSDTISTIVGPMLGDDVCNAITVTVGTNGPYSTTTATTQTGDPAPPTSGAQSWLNATLSNTLWFKFIAPASGHVSIQSPGFDTQLALWSASTCSGLSSAATRTLIAANDDDAAYTTHGGVEYSSYLGNILCLVPGQTYFIELDPYTSPGGSTTIVITDLGTVNASFTGLSPLYCGGAAPVTMTPVVSGGVFSGNHVSGSTYTPVYGSVDTVVYTLNGCYRDTVIVGTFNKPSTPTVTLSQASATICSNDTLVLTSSYVGGNTWSTSSTTDTIKVVTAGSYTVIYTDNNGCSSDPSAAVNVVVNTSPPAPIINAFGSTTFCQGGSVALASNQGSGNTWSNGDLNSVISVNTTGPYYATYTDGNGCVSDTSNNIYVSVNPSPAAPVITASGPVSFCSGDSVILYSSYNSMNTWSDASTDTALVVTMDGTYMVSYTDPNGCNSPQSAPVVVTINTTVASADYTFTDTGLQVDFTNASTDATSYAWDFGDGAGTDNTANPSYTYTSAGTYTVQLIAYNGCGNDTITYDVTVVDPLGLATVPVNNLSVLPNPSNGLLNINFTSGASELLTIKLMSATGQVVVNESYNNVNGKYAHTMDLSHLANGVYLLQISNANGIINKKVVLTK